MCAKGSFMNVGLVHSDLVIFEMQVQLRKISYTVQFIKKIHFGIGKRFSIVILFKTR